MFWSGSDDPRRWHPKRRRTVLGRWHEIKLGMWDEHIHYCDEATFRYNSMSDEVPF